MQIPNISGSTAFGNSPRGHVKISHLINSNVTPAAEIAAKKIEETAAGFLFNINNGVQALFGVPNLALDGTEVASFAPILLPTEDIFVSVRKQPKNFLEKFVDFWGLSKEEVAKAAGPDSDSIYKAALSALEKIKKGIN